jgi:hypothetical protein
VQYWLKTFLYILWSISIDIQLLFFVYSTQQKANSHHSTGGKNRKEVIYEKVIIGFIGYGDVGWMGYGTSTAA